MKNNSGFTLIELMVSIAIFAILSAIAIPNMIAWRNHIQFNSAVRTLKISIEETRMAAIRSNMPARMDFIDGGNTFDTVRWDPIANTFATPVTHQLPPGTILANSSFASDELQFNSRGMSNNGTVTLRNDSGLCSQIVVAMVGSSRIDVCP